ncbi:hypothetical protein Sru01_20330 [Sphaerisporangium rufum]|uniref:Activator of Hsp90 ATPase homologue 1/2-like C-terminal domain-containing protein n=1 Tax=Sphaerisporangium rufum TaxID=1381558 RepID=A0A919UXI7_9ACTN|nr:SRPBCC family protein [Sphaerisporangium rufum]GII77051.1 hypothetical protein Sru01_20330 [Sphaerisporangium rufum]
MFRFFVEPDAFARWFVVPGFRTPAGTVRVDARPGGGVSATMVSDDGATRLPFTVGFGELDPPRRIVFHPGDGERVIVTLTPSAGGTELVYAYDGPAAGAGDIAAVEAMLDRIAANL